jgi:hypothetical protein
MNSITILPLIALAFASLSGCAADADEVTENDAAKETTGLTQNLASAIGNTKGTERNCVTDMGTGVMACYATFTEAFSAATGGRIMNAPAEAKLAENDAALAQQVARLEQVQTMTHPLMTIYEDDNYGGRNNTYSAVYDGKACENGRWWYLDYVGDDWNDQISSLRDWTNEGTSEWSCKVTVYWDRDLVNACATLTDTPWLWQCDDAVSSISLAH